MASSSSFSKVDEYGFERPNSFNYEIYGNFMSQYIRTLAKRAKRWDDLKGHEKFRKGGTLKRFVRKGIPLPDREAVWMHISGAQTLKEESGMHYSTLRKKINNPTLIETIQIDIPRTFPDNIFFNKDSALPMQLFNVLATFAHHNNEIGYCQGLNYIAGLLLLATKNEESSFWLLKALIDKILPRYYVKNMSGLLVDLEVLDELVQKYEPQVYRHIKRIGMPWAVSSTKWFICLYSEVLPIETVLRIWDCLFYEGSKIIFRVGLTLIRLHRNDILQAQDLGELVTCFRGMSNSYSVVNCHQFIAEVFKEPSSFPNKMLDKLRKKHAR